MGSGGRDSICRDYITINKIFEEKNSNNLLKIFQQHIFSRSLVFEYEHEHEGEYNLNELTRQSSLDNYKSRFPFMNKTISKDKNTAVQVLLDMSGSMMGDKIKQAKKIAILFAETFKKLNISFEVCGYNSNKKTYNYNNYGRTESVDLYLFKKFTDQDCSQLYFIDKCAAASNADGGAMEMAADRLYNFHCDRRIMFYICDGQPTGYANHQAGINHMREVCKNIYKNGMEFYCIGIDTDAVSIFGKELSFCVRDNNDLALNISKLIAGKI